VEGEAWEMTIYHREHGDLGAVLEAFDNARWSVACREMQVRIARGHFSAAVRRLEAFLCETEPGYATMQSHVVTVFPLKLAMALEGAGYETAEAVARATNTELMEIENVGVGAVEMIRSTVRRIAAGQVVEVPADEDYEAKAEEAHRLKMTDAQLEFEIGRLSAALRRLKRIQQVRNAMH
jgi:hypothetical protein